ncbi:1780_t:CDS:10, partial [Racocetra persica]
TFEALAEYHAKEYLPDMQRLDEWLREQVVFFVKCKNAMTSTMISSLQQISYFESTIAGIPGTLSSLESEIKLKAQEFKKLSSIRQMPLAYAMTLIEILRRSEYTKLFLSKAQQLAEAMANFRNLEQKRRDNYRLDVKSYVPLNISALDDNPPMCEVSTLNLRDDRLPSFSKADVKAFFDLIEKIRPVILSQASLFKSQIAASSLFKTRDQQTIQQTVIDILSSLQSKSARSYGQIERMDVEFDKIVEKIFHLERLDIDKNNQTLSRPVSIFEGRSLAPPSPQMGRRASRTSRQSFSEDSGSTADSTTDRILLETIKELDRSKETIKKYEARIKKLEDLLHTNYQSTKNSTVLADTHKPDSKFSISAIEQELSDLRLRYNELESIYNSELNNKAELEMLHLQLKKSHNEKSNQLEELQNHVNELNKALLDERSEKKTLCDKYDSKIQELESLLHESNKKNADLEKELEILKADNELIKKEKDTVEADLEKKVEVLKADNELIKKEKDAVEADLDKKLEILKADNELIKKEKDAVEADLEKKLEILKADNELVKKEKDAVEAETLTLDSKVNNTLAENNKLKSQLEDIQKQNEERERLHKQELDQLLKQSDERSETDKQNMLQEIEGLKQEIEDWKLNLEKMNSAREDLEQDLAKSRERVKFVEQDYNERTKALTAAEKLIKGISETVNEYMHIVTSNKVSSNSEQTESDDNLDPIIMIRKVGDVAKYLDQKLRETSQSLDKSSTLNTNLEHSLNDLRRMLEERTEFSKGLSKSLWEYYSNLRKLMKTMKLNIPTLADNYAMSVISMPQDDDKKIGVSDREDLSKFFLNDSSDEQSVWPKDKYETLLSLTMKVKLDEVRDLIVRTLKEAKGLAKQHREDSKSNREKYQKVSQESRDKIAFQNFKIDDVALFLPTRSSPLKTYAAFNHNCPYYFLRVTDASKNKDYIIGRIIKISDHIAQPEYNPYELPVGVKYYIIDADENWQNAFNNSHNRRCSMNTSDTATRIHKNRQSLPSRSLSSSAIISNDVRPQS